MAKKLIKVMDTSFRDGFQSVYGARVFVDDFLPALKAAVDAGIKHFEVAGGARITMIIAAALVEGATFFALVICLLMIL